MAAVARLSPSHFARQFKAATGLPPHQFVIMRRVERPSSSWKAAATSPWRRSPRTPASRTRARSRITSGGSSASRRGSSGRPQDSPRRPQVLPRNRPADLPYSFYSARLRPLPEMREGIGPSYRRLTANFGGISWLASVRIGMSACSRAASPGAVSRRSATSHGKRRHDSESQSFFGRSLPRPDHRSGLMHDRTRHGKRFSNMGVAILLFAALAQFPPVSPSTVRASDHRQAKPIAPALGHGRSRTCGRLRQAVRQADRGRART